MTRLKKLFKWMGIALLSMISVVILVVTIMNWRASREVEVRLAPLREAGKPISIQDLKPAAVPDANNAARAVQRYADALREFDRQLAHATNEIETEAEHEAASIRVARSVVQEFPDLNDALRTASGLPAYQRDLDYESGPTALMDQFIHPEVSPRTIVRVLYGHGLMCLADGHTAEAAQDAMAILNWSEHVERQPLMLNHLIAVACYSQGIDLAAKCIHAGDTTPAVRTSLLTSYSDESSMHQNHAHSLDTERAFGISSFATFPFNRFRLMLGELASYLDTVSEFESFVEQPTGIGPDQPKTSGILAGLSWPALQQSVAVLRRQQAQGRAIQILAAWQDAGSDREATLADLDLPDSVTTDPFNGERMKMPVVEDKILIYSVGEDMLDNGGSMEDGRDIGIALPRD